MKANKFAIEQDDEAVSPVIAVILMVAITVVLAATVYVWVSGFGTDRSIRQPTQFSLADASDDVAAAGVATDVLAVLSHRGGEVMDWGEFNVTTYNGEEITWVNYDTASDCSGEDDALPATDFQVGGKLYLCARAAGDFNEGDRLRVQIVDSVGGTVVYENAITLA